MTATITRAEAITALAAATAEGMEGDTNSYFITSAAPQISEDAEYTVFMVGYAAEDPTESDFEGDPTAFARNADGTVTCTGPAF